MRPVKILIRLRECAGWSESSLDTCPNESFRALRWIVCPVHQPMVAQKRPETFFNYQRSLGRLSRRQIDGIFLYSTQKIRLDISCDIIWMKSQTYFLGKIRKYFKKSLIDLFYPVFSVNHCRLNELPTLYNGRFYFRFEACQAMRFRYF